VGRFGLCYGPFWLYDGPFWTMQWAVLDNFFRNLNFWGRFGRGRFGDGPFWYRPTENIHRAFVEVFIASPVFSGV